LVNKEPVESSQNEQLFGGFTRCTKKCAFCNDVKGESVIRSVPDIFSQNLPPQDARRGLLRSLKIPSATCSTENLVYLCGCTVCGLFYVGETGDTFNRRCSRHRMLQHDREKFLKDGVEKNWSEVRRHFVTEHHKDAFWVAPLAVFPKDAPDSHRKKKEQFWIRKLRPKLNIKLNQENQRGRASSTGSNPSPPASPVIRRRLGHLR
jgi:hypothetical protein